MSAHIETFRELMEQTGYAAGLRIGGSSSDDAMELPVVVHCLDTTYPIVHVHVMPDGSIGIEIALHESDEPCNCPERKG